MDSTAEPVAVEFPEKPMPTPIDTSTTSIPTPEASATTTSAKKKKKKKKKKSKSGSEAGSLSASTPTSPMIGPDEEDEEISGPLTPSDSTEDNNSDHNLPPTPLSASGVLPLMEETPEAVAIEEAATVPVAVVKDERTEDEPAKMEMVPILEEEPTVEPLEEEEKAAAADEPVAGGKDDEAHGQPESDVAAPVADEPVHETSEPINGDVVAVAETVAKAEPTAEVAELEEVNRTTEHTEPPHSEPSEAKDEEETTEHPPKADAPVEDIVAILDEPKVEETAETPDDHVEKEDEMPGENSTPTEPTVEETPTVEEAGETPEVAAEAEHVEETTPEDAEETPEVAPEAEHVEEAGETPEVVAEAEHVEETTPEVEEAGETTEVAAEVEYVEETTPEVEEAGGIPEVAAEAENVEETTPEEAEETPEVVAEAEHVEETTPEGEEAGETPEVAKVEAEHVEEAPSYPDVAVADDAPKTEAVASETEQATSEIAEEADAPQTEIEQSHKTEETPEKEVPEAKDVSQIAETTKTDEEAPAHDEVVSAPVEPASGEERPEKKEEVSDEEEEIVHVSHDDAPLEEVAAADAAVGYLKPENATEKKEDEVADAEQLDQPEPTATKEETEVAEKLDEPEVKATEIAEATEEPSQEVKVNPLPASESGENPIHLHPGEEIPKEITAEAISTHVELGQESYEGEEPTVPVVPQELQEDVAIEFSAEDLSREFKVVPLPAFENAENPIQLEAGEPIPDNITTASIQDNVKLDKESYESEEPNVPSMPAEETLAAAEKEEEQEVKVAPLPAFENAENPMQLAPGEPIPENVTAAGIYDNVRLDIESYESEEPTVPLAPAEEASPAADRDQEVKVTPLPAFENAENPIQLAPGEPVPDLATASIDEHVRLDEESFESTESTVPVVPVGDLEQEAKVAPLPAFRNAENPIQLQPGEPIPEGFATAAAQDHVKLDQESYENTAPSVPIAVPKETKAETVQEVAETAAEVADVAQKLDEPTPEEAKNIEPTSEGVQVQEPAATAKDAPVTPTKDKTAVEPARETTGVDMGDFIVPGTLAGTMVAAAATATVLSRKPDGVEDKPVGSPNVEHLVDETVSHKKPDASPVTKAVDESTAHRSAGEELITEPAPQASPSSVHGEIVPEADVPKILLDTKATQGATPTVVVSSPVTPEDDGQSAHTVEIVQPTPAENSPEGIRRRKGLAAPSTHERPTSSGSDIVSTRKNHNIMHNFWQVFFLGWIGGVGRFFSGFFRKKKEKSAAKAATTAAAATANAGATR